MIDDAEAILGSIRRAVLLDLQEPGTNSVFAELDGEIDALQQQIAASDNDDLKVKVDLLKTLARAAAETGQERTKFQILDVLSWIESVLVRFDLSEPTLSDELLEIVDASFDSFPKPQKVVRIERDPILQLEVPSDDDFDTELLEIFVEEAEQLLSAFEEQLRVSKTDPSDKEVVWELRRIAHTFKGAAGVVGLKAAADLAHRLENTLDRLAASSEHHIAHLLPLLEPSVAVLRDLARGGGSSPHVEAVQKELDLLLGDYPAATEQKHAPKKKKLPTSDLSHPATVSRDKKAVVRVSLAVLDLIDQRVREFTKTLSSLRQSLDPTTGNTGSGGSFRELFELQFFLANSIMEELRSIRMIEFGTLTPRLQRAVRVACEEESKRAEILIENADTKIDTVVMDSLVEPLMHLLRNSVVHGIESPETRRLLGKPESGMIRVRLSESAGHIEIALTDDGRGIDTNALKARAVELGIISSENVESADADEAYDLIFYEGLSTATKLTLQAGRGVGMRIVRDSIQELKGTIAIDSARNVGTTFTIKFPKVEHGPEGKGAAQNPVILSIDDSLSVRKANRKIIEDLGFTSVLAGGGNEALKLLNESERLPDLIITDLEMPGMDGFEFIAALKKSDRLSEIPVVVLSTKTDQISRDMAFQLGAVECFEKPLDRQELRMVANVFVKN
jgi:CheY-like chemotaxis protein/HPt (histidine-containing phosphotransfer) domain-containing protein/two-component sensor histidine kinase